MKNSTAISRGIASWVIISILIYYNPLSINSDVDVLQEAKDVGQVIENTEIKYIPSSSNENPIDNNMNIYENNTRINITDNNSNSFNPEPLPSKNFPQYDALQLN